MPTEEPLGEVLDFMRLLWGLDHALQSASKRMSTSLGVTGPQRLAVRLIGRFPGITPGRLAELQRLHPSTLTGIIDRLKERGIIDRHVDTQDHRRVHLSLTQKGSEVDALSEGTVEATVRRALSRLDPQHVESARLVLRALDEEITAEVNASSATPA